MFNLLPKLSEEVTKVEKSKLSYWKPENADPAKAKISATLEKTFSVDVESSVKYKENTLPKPEPNFIPRSEIERLDPSLISEENRGVPDDPVISTQMFIDAKKEENAGKPRPPKIVLDEMAKLLRVKVYNYMKFHRLELFLQSQAKIANASLRPFREYSKILDGQLPISATVTPGGFGEEGEREGDLLYFYCSSALRATVTSTNRQEVKDYRFFANKRIGLEVELVSHKLVVSKVLPETQAFPYEKMLDGSEIVAINGERVVDLEEFQAAMVRAKKNVFVTLKIASYPEGRQKIDDLYQQNVDKSNQMKSLFSNLMGSIEDERRLQVNPRRSSMLFAEDDDDDDNEGRALEESSAKKEQPSARRSPPARRSTSGSPTNARRTSTSSVASSPKSARTPRKSKRRSKVQSPHERQGRRTSARAKRDATSFSPESRREVDGSRSGDFTETEPENESEKEKPENESEKEKEDFQQIIDSLNDDPLFSLPGKIDESIGKEETNFDGEDDGGGGGMIAGKALVEREDLLSEREDPPFRPPVIDTQETEEKDKEDDNSSVEDWNILTRVDAPAEVAVYSFSTLVCMPSPFLSHSKRWGNPKFHLQFSNFSACWRMEIYWIDEKGVLVPRGSHDLLQGDTHYELFSAAHVWAVIATPLKNPLVAGAGSKSSVAATSLLVNRSSMDLTSAVPNDGNRSPADPVPEGSLSTSLDPPLGSSSQVNAASLSTSLAPSSTELSQLIFVFRPSKACCSQETKCLSVLWSPGQSLTVSQLLYSKPVKSTHRSFVPPNRHKEERIKPSIHIQLFETKGNAAPSLPIAPMASSAAPSSPTPFPPRADSREEDLGKLTRKPLRTTRALSRMTKK